MRRTLAVAVAAVLLSAGAASAAEPVHDGNTPTRPLTPLGKQLADSMQPAATPSPDAPEKDRAAPKNEPPGTLKTYHFWYGPYTIEAGSDAQHVDLGLPLDNGFMITVEPRLRNMDMSTPSMLTGHIHHAHWFVANNSGLEWIFGNGDEGTRASFAVMNAFDPIVNYGQFIGKDDKQLMVYMLHNRTAKRQKWWVDLEVQFLFGTEKQLNTPELKAKRGGKEFRDVKSILSGATFDVPRQPKGDGSWNTTEATTLKGAGLTTDLKPGGTLLDKLGSGLERLGSMGFGMPARTDFPNEWIVPQDGTLMEVGTHMHPGSTHALIENMGSPSNPCPNDGKGTGGTLLLRADAVNMHVPFSDDYQIEITQPGWRVPVRKGDHIRYTAFYENKDHAWAAAMDVTGIGVDYRRKPAAGVRCTVDRVGPALRVKDIRDIPGRGVVAPDYTGSGVPSVMSFEGGWPADTPEGRAYAARKAAAARKAKTRTASKKKAAKKAKKKKAKVKDVGDLVIPITDGIPNRAWHHGVSPYCGEEYGARACERTVAARPAGADTSLVTISNFLYTPGDLGLPGANGAPPRVHKGKSLMFFNLDGLLLIRHSVSTCAWPCNGPYVTNYPKPDGVWESGTFGVDPLGDGMVLQQAQTPKDLDVGKYAYYCRIHPWMRGAFEVVP
jgi:hypothetical protein